VPATDLRTLPLASVRLYDKGQGDPIVTDHGFVWYDILAHTHSLGTATRDASGITTLEYLDGIGLVCRPQLIPQDTRLAHYTRSGGTWEERRPTVGAPRKYRLVQADASANLRWSATSIFSLPENPHIAFGLVFIDTPSDHNFDVYPPYVRIELGGGDWALEFSKFAGARLLRSGATSGTWEVVQDLPTLGDGGTDLNEKLVLLRCLRGRIGVSVDFGKSYVWFGDGSGATIPAGKFTVRGQGGMVVFGLHQLKYVSGAYTSPPKSTYMSRVLATPALGGRYSQPTGTNVLFTDNSDGPDGVARYQVTISPGTTPGTPFTFYRTPEIYAVRFSYPVLRTVPSLAFTIPWDGSILAIDIEKDLDLANSSATIRIRRDAAVQFTGDYRWRKIEIILGHRLENGTEEGVIAFTGYIREITPAQDEYGKTTLEITCENVSIRPRRQSWDDFTGPLGGQTVNQALDVVLDSMGLGAAYRSWHSAGDHVILPAGLAEDPTLWPKAGEAKWDTLQLLAAYAGLEIAVTDTGGFSTGPVDYVDTAVSWEWEADPAAPGASQDGQAAIHQISYRFDSSESYTGVVVKGTDETGNGLWAYGIDTAAELDPASPRFSPWRELMRDEAEGTVTLGILQQRAITRYLQHVPLKFEPDIEVPVNLNVLRRQRVRILNTTAGITSSDEFVVFSLRHHYEFDPSFSRLTTTAGLRRL